MNNENVCPNGEVIFQQSSTSCHMEIYAAVYTVSDDKEVSRQKSTVLNIFLR